MYRVMIVDDEPWALKGIRATFQWEELGFEVVAETTDPQAAYEMIVSEEPDVVLTDIRMPEISGIELLRKSREYGVHTEFVMISGVADFHFSRESNRLGCFDYILKPLEYEEANGVLARLSRYLHDKSRQQDEMLLEALYSREMEQVSKFLSKRGIPLSGCSYQVLHVLTSSPEQLEAVRGRLLAAEHKLFIRLEANRMIALIAHTEPTCSSWAERLAEPDFLSAGVRIGVSRPTSALKDVARRMEEAHMALSTTFVQHASGSKQPYGVFVYRNEMRPSIRRSIQDVCAAIRQHSAEQADRLLADIPRLFREEEAGIKEVVALWNGVIPEMNHRFAESEDWEELAFLDHRGILEQFANVDDLCRHLRYRLQPLSDAVSDPCVNEQFRKLLSFVDSHFTEDMHLWELSQTFFINYTYCSDLFRKTTKVTFTDYITKLRMDKARRLLRDSSLSIMEVCHRVGYKDYHYLSVANSCLKH